MKRGRLTKEEQTRRIKALLVFIYIFRYATRKQLEIFTRLVMKLSFTRWLIDYSADEGFIGSYYEPLFRIKIFYLTNKGREMISSEVMVEHYHFEKSYAGLNTFIHHNKMIEAFILLKSQLDIKEWTSEWDLRHGKLPGEKIPDGLITLAGGLTIALEVETRYKTLEALKTFIKKYHYDIEKLTRYKCLLVVSSNRPNYEGLRTRFYNIAPEFCSQYVILTDLEMLELKTCYYQDKLMHIEEALRLVREGVKINGQTI